MFFAESKYPLSLDSLDTTHPHVSPTRVPFHPHRSNNKYYSEDHPVIRSFWKALRELTTEQRKNFIRFAWGRSRLPRGKWPLQSNGQQVKFTIVPRRNVHTGIPLAHTCFFLIELPEYQDFKELKRMLLLACVWGSQEGFLIA